jgi:hypothetical protein
VFGHPSQNGEWSTRSPNDQSSIFDFRRVLTRKGENPFRADITDAIAGPPRSRGRTGLLIPLDLPSHRRRGEWRLGRQPFRLDRWRSEPVVAEPAFPPGRAALPPRAPGDAPSADRQTRSVLARRARRGAAPRSETRTGPTSPCGRVALPACALPRSALGRSPAATPQSATEYAAGSARAPGTRPG